MLSWVEHEKKKKKKMITSGPYFKVYLTYKQVQNLQTEFWYIGFQTNKTYICRSNVSLITKTKGPILISDNNLQIHVF